MSEVAPLISDLAVILIAAGLVTLLFKWLKQPVVLGYIVAGIFAGPAIPFVPTVTDVANIKIWADIGVIFLLFAMGLEFSFRKLMSVGSTAVVAAVFIVSGMMFLMIDFTLPQLIFILSYKRSMIRSNHLLSN